MYSVRDSFRHVFTLISVSHSFLKMSLNLQGLFMGNKTYL